VLGHRSASFIARAICICNIPACATPKDGPSAGIAIATSDRQRTDRHSVRGDVAMTGEITLRGRVFGNWRVEGEGCGGASERGASRPHPASERPRPSRTFLRKFARESRSYPVQDEWTDDLALALVHVDFAADRSPPSPALISDDRPENRSSFDRWSFIGGMASVAGWRPESSLPEIAFAGRSNVGSLPVLNRLIHRKKMAQRQQYAGANARGRIFSGSTTHSSR
jgi:hypothetical protein